MKKSEVEIEADRLIKRWGFLCAGVEAWKMKTFNMPPNKKFWKEVEQQIKTKEDDSLRNCDNTK